MSNVNNLGYDEVVDTLSDVIEIAKEVEKVLSDGFQPLPDLIALVPVFSKVQEIINDAAIAKAQLMDLSVDEASAAVDQIAARTGVDSTKVAEKVNIGLSVLLDLYEAYVWNLNKFLTVKDKVKQLVD